MILSWEDKARIARKGCGLVWPKICQLRAELHTYESVHGYFSNMRIEAERHLVQVIKLPSLATMKGPERRAEALLKKAVKLSPEQKERLILALEGRAE